MAAFQPALEKTLRWEGGYTVDISGGKTNFGISQKSYPNITIENLTRDQAAAIYRRDYWTPMLLDGIKSQPVADMIFDFAVNAGRSQATKTLRKILGSNRTGAMSAADVKEINFLDPDKFLWSYGVARVSFYRSLALTKPDLAKYLGGWLKRAQSFFLELIQRRAVMIGGPLAIALLLFLRYKSKHLKQITRATHDSDNDDDDDGN